METANGNYSKTYEKDKCKTYEKFNSNDLSEMCTFLAIFFVKLHNFYMVKAIESEYRMRQLSLQNDRDREEEFL
jgi:hypothetical protein